MAEIITKQKLVEANENASAWEKYWAGGDDENVITRLNKMYPTHAKALKILMENGGLQPFESEAELLAYIPEVDPTAAKALDTKKVWIWKQTSAEGVEPKVFEWVDTGLSEVDQAKDFTVSANRLENKFQLKGLHMYGGNITIPLHTDESDAVIFGYNPNNDELYGNGLIDPKLMNSMHINSNTNIYPILTDSNNKVILGYDSENDKLIGLFPETNSNPCVDVPLPFNMISKAVNMMLGYGQSLSTGVGSNVVLSSSQPFFNKTFASGVRGNGGDFSSQKPLVEDNLKPTPDGETNAGETICSGSANYASLSAYKENGVNPSDHVIFASTAGHGNYQISQLNKGTEWYNSQFLGHLNGAKALNPNIALHAVNWLQGEADSAGDQTTHYNALIQLQKDIEADAKEVTGQTSPTLFFVYQHSTFIYKRPAVALALLSACQTSDKFYFIAPTYAFPPAADNIHLSAVAYKWLGAYYGRAYKQSVHDKIKPRSIMPKGATINGTKIRVKFSVPHKPLVLDTTNLANTTQYGFAVFDGSTEVLINSVYVENGDEVVLDLSRTLNSTVTVNYAIDYLASSLNLFKGASGNLRDSCTETVMINNTVKPMFYICPHFSLTAISEII